MLLTIFSAGLLIASDNEGEELIEIIVPPKPVQQTVQQLPETQSIKMQKQHLSFWHLQMNYHPSQKLQPMDQKEKNNQCHKI